MDALYHTRAHPFAYASSTLSPAGKKYSQIEKEALSVIYGVKKCHQYLMTDHRPLVTFPNDDCCSYSAVGHYFVSL